MKRFTRLGSAGSVLMNLKNRAGPRDGGSESHVCSIACSMKPARGSEHPRRAAHCATVFDGPGRASTTRPPPKERGGGRSVAGRQP